MPLISVVMPMYNAKPYIETAIKSVLTQTKNDLELIIVDDASTDSSAEVVESIKDDRIKLTRMEKNSGSIEAANKALSLANGKYIARMDADDIAKPKRFEIELDFLDQHQECVMVGSSAKPFFEGGGRAWQYPNSFGGCRARALFSAPLLHPTIMARGWLFEKISYKEQLVDDYDMMLQALNHGELYSILQILLEYRIHKKSLSHSNVEKQFNASNALHTKELAKIGNFSSQETILHTRIARYENFGSLEDVYNHLEKIVKLGSEKYAPKQDLQEICDFFYAEAFLARSEPLKNYRGKIKPILLARHIKKVLIKQ
ncbi:MAG: hypothetical protein RL154_1289 [Pseudomonadota bacterium]